MVTAVDTNMAIEFIKGNQKVKDKLSKFNVTYLPITVVGELLFGAINSGKKEKKLLETKIFIEKCEILNINYIVAEKYAEIRESLKLKGKPIPENDIWIAATCSANNISLITNDKHFNNIDQKFLQTV